MGKKANRKRAREKRRLARRVADQAAFELAHEDLFKPSVLILDDPHAAQPSKEQLHRWAMERRRE